jgi:antitoxin (DNA-binding transcriptional repressor) of toxin-antitoxin stability system
MEVGLREAKAKLSQLIVAVQSGERVTITRHGAAVAELTRPKQPTPADNVSFFDRIQKARAGRGLTVSGPDLPDNFDDPAFSRQVLGLTDSDA